MVSYLRLLGATMKLTKLGKREVLEILFFEWNLTWDDRLCLESICGHICQCV